MYLQDQLGFSIDCDEILQHLIKTQNNSLIVGITFKDVNENFDIGEQEVITSQVIFSLKFFLLNKFLMRSSLYLIEYSELSEN